MFIIQDREIFQNFLQPKTEAPGLPKNNVFIIRMTFPEKLIENLAIFKSGS